MRTISGDEFERHVIDGKSIIDVRSPGEFLTGSIPGSVNIPILDDLERHQVGLCYKLKGQEAAVRLGYEIVSGTNLEQKRAKWLEHITKHPDSVLTCFRGGLRSQSAQKFILEHGATIPRLEKGFKFARAFFIETISTSAETFNFLILTGSTGSGKTHLLNHIGEFHPAIDLEGLAHHRGSAFGAWDIPQPSQIDFENRLARCFLKLASTDQKKQILLEDESRLIGHRHLPEVFFTKMRASNVVLLSEPLENRIENIFTDYISSKINSKTTAEDVMAVLSSYKNSVQKIKTKLGGLRAQELMHDLELCEKDFIQNRLLDKNKTWIEKLLVWYYDPMYSTSLNTRNPFILFQGSRLEVKAYFQSLI